ncbi:MAG: DNA polymerase III subunit beta [Candidatus Latescibacterota bacterium]|nr:DNA polymerase III subunit beta [Candidatus Latescibacterota bacterium]MEE2874488.1 DNA polymerase III subunit beta [Candidatus Latescibacterota bacterium]
MKLSVNRNELWQGIDTVLDAVPSKPALPVLANILLVAEDNTLALSATDLDLSIRTEVPATVEQKGRITVPARTFADIAREWPEAELSILVENDRLRLSGDLGDAESGEGAYSLSGMAADEFPGMPTSLEGVSISFGDSEELNAKLLLDMINKTSFAVSKDDTRPVLNGVLWRIDSEGMEMVATDGSRLACYRRSLDLGVQSDQEAGVIVPPQALTQMGKLLSGHDGAVEVTLGETQLFLSTGTTHLLSRLIEGPYVDYAQVIPKENDKNLRVDINRLLPTVRRVSILSSSYTRQVRLKLDVSSIELSAASPEIGGEAREQIPASFDGEEMEIGYNAQFLMEILRKMDTQTVRFELNNNVTAALLKPDLIEEGEDYFCLLMPLRPTG